MTCNLLFPFCFFFLNTTYSIPPFFYHKQQKILPCYVLMST